MFKRLGKDKKRLKKEIWRGVYEENLKISGRREGVEGRRIRDVFIKYMIFILFLLFGVMGEVDYLNLELIRSFEIDYPNHRLKEEGIKSDLKRKENPDTFEFKGLFYNPDVPLSEIFDLRIHTIVIDPGHGGEDSGAIGSRGIMEKDITLDIAKRLRRRLNRYKNYQVLLTREDDRTVSLNERIDFANSAKADLFISIHVNYLPRKPINIIETYYFGSYSDKGTLRLAERENRGSKYSLADFREIIKRIGDTVKLQESKRLAISIQKSLFENISRENKGVFDFGIKTAPFMVLLGVEAPSVLTEVSCLSNKEEEMRLNTGEYREKIASYLEEGIVRYLNKKIKGEERYEARKLGTKQG